MLKSERISMCRTWVEIKAGRDTHIGRGSHGTGAQRESIRLTRTTHATRVVVDTRRGGRSAVGWARRRRGACRGEAVQSAASLVVHVVLIAVSVALGCLAMVLGVHGPGSLECLAR